MWEDYRCVQPNRRSDGFVHKNVEDESIRWVLYLIYSILKILWFDCTRFLHWWWVRWISPERVRICPTRFLLRQWSYEKVREEQYKSMSNRWKNWFVLVDSNIDWEVIRNCSMFDHREWCWCGDFQDVVRIHEQSSTQIEESIPSRKKFVSFSTISNEWIIEETRRISKKKRSWVWLMGGVFKEFDNPSVFGPHFFSLSKKYSYCCSIDVMQ